MSREVNANGGRDSYRAVAAEANVAVRARRSKPSKLESNGRLRTVVDKKLAEFWSPEQIAGWLRVDHPDDPSMRMSHQAIYLAVYAGHREARPKQCLRTRRPIRRRGHRRKNQGQGMILGLRYRRVTGFPCGWFYFIADDGDDVVRLLAEAQNLPTILADTEQD